MTIAGVLERMPRQQKAAGRLLVGFFALMLVLTLLSRGLAAFTIPTVSTTTARAGTLTHKVSGDGSLAASDEVAVTALAGVRILQLFAEEGSRVEEGAPLAQLDVDEMAKALQTGYLELEKLRVNRQINEFPADSSLDDWEVEEAQRTLEDAQLALERAMADQEKLENEADLDIVTAQRNYDDARKELRDLEKDDEATDAEISAQRRTAREYRATLDQAYRALKDGQEAAQRKVEDEQRKVQGAEAELEKALRDLDKAGEELLSKEQKQALEGRLTALDIQIKQQELSDMEALREQGGLILSPYTGVVTKVGGSTGALTSSEALFVISRAGGEAKFRAYVDEKDLKYISRGDRAEVNLTGLGSRVEGVVESITSAGGDKQPEITVLLPAGEYEPGMAGTLYLEKETAPYNTCVPVEALHQDTKGYYLLALEESQGVTGEVTVVRRIDVSVTARDSSRAAIDAPVTDEDRIILSSSRSVTVGEQVREEYQ